MNATVAEWDGAGPAARDPRSRGLTFVFWGFLTLVVAPWVALAVAMPLLGSNTASWWWSRGLGAGVMWSGNLPIAFGAWLLRRESRQFTAVLIALALSLVGDLTYPSLANGPAEFAGLVDVLNFVLSVAVAWFLLGGVAQIASSRSQPGVVARARRWRGFYAAACVVYSVVNSVELNSERLHGSTVGWYVLVLVLPALAVVELVFAVIVLRVLNRARHPIAVAQ